ncbi:MAG: toll/interleukin-1 receptor domain-containing protein [Helicobacteraceae bacterium]|nr:toll/interleukin-1 receptor domain-containing protein [Helicobacteraceae bacterium]
MKHWEQKANGWVFLSHSSTDYENVKVVRNYLEENGFSALMFYLKCLEENDKKDKIQELLKWEISARNIFVLCDSEAAKKSKWVKWETDYVKNQPGKIYKEIDIDKLRYQKCTQLSILDDLMNKATLYFSYSSKDRTKVEIVYEKLNSIGFRIFKDIPDMKKGKNNQIIQSKLHEALQEINGQGVVVIFLSENAKSSPWFWKEKTVALEQEAFIIPIRIDNVSIDEFPAFRNLQYIDMRDGVSDNQINRLINIINERDIR